MKRLALYKKLTTTSILSLVLSTNIAYAEDVVLRYSQWLPGTHWSQYKGLQPWFEEIAGLKRLQKLPKAA